VRAFVQKFCSSPVANYRITRVSCKTTRGLVDMLPNGRIDTVAAENELEPGSESRLGVRVEH